MPAMPIQLNYRGAAGVDDMNAFNARTNIMWKGDLLFRIYEQDGKLYFIKMGGSKRSGRAVAVQFGLLGALIAYFASKHAEKKTKERLNQFAGVPPQELLGMDKVNHLMDVGEITEPALNPGSFWNSNKFGSFSFRNAKRRKTVFTFDDADNFQAAARRLPQMFGDALRVHARWDEQRRKVVKAQ